MADRYIQRRRASPRQYTPGCPVILAGAALLEDTQAPRLVAQLKFTSLSPAVITGLHGLVHCFGADDADAGTVAFQHQSLGVRRGQSFGQYTAITLPQADIVRFRVTVERVVFADGTDWTVPVGAVWGILPPFTPLSSALSSPRLLALSRSALPNARYAYADPGDLWYCTCGGVNRDHETACHRCAAARGTVEQYAAPARLAGLEQSRREEGERQRAAARQQEAERREQVRAAAEAKANAVREKMAETVRKKPHSQEKKPRQVNRLVLCGAAAAALVAGFLFLPKLANLLPEAAAPASSASADHTQPPPVDTAAPQPEERPVPDEAFPSGEEAVFVDVTADEWGACTVNTELVQPQIPEAKYINFFGVPAMGDQLDSYLVNCFQMGSLMRDGDSQGEWGKFTPADEGKSSFCLLVFDGATHLIGYFVGVPEKIDDDTWRFRVSQCDYDFSALYEKQRAAFEAGQDGLYDTYIPLADVADSGAVYCLQGYYTGRSPNPREDACQTYHLWSQLNSPHLTQFARGIDRIAKKQPRDGSYLFFLLLDQEYDLIGYTMVGSG